MKCILCDEIVLPEMGMVSSPNGDWVAHMECILIYGATLATDKPIDKKDGYGN